MRLTTVLVLSSHGEKLEENAVNPLIQALKEPDEYQQRLITHTLSSMGEVTVEPLIELLKDERSDINKHVARALGATRSNKAVEPLINLLDDEDPDVRFAVVAALGVIGGEKAVDHLIKHLTDDDRNVKVASIRALGNIEDTRAAVPLNIALNDPDPLVRMEASEALGKLTGEACPLVTSLTRYDAVSYTWVIVLALVLLFALIGTKIKPIDRFLRKIFSRFALPVKLKWWIMVFLGIGALALFVWCYICKYGEGAAAFALQKPGFLPTLYLYSFRVFPFFIGGCILSGYILRFFSGRWRLPSNMLGSTTLGAVIPLCSCATIPMVRGMLAAKMPIRAAIAFLIATPILSPFIIFMSYGVIGLKFTLVRIISVFILAIVAGLFIEKVVGREEVEKDTDFQNLCKGCARASMVHDTTNSPLIIAWNQIRYLLKYMVLGVFLGALLEEYLPISIVAKYMNSSFLGLFAATTVGLPLYLCSGQEVLLLKPLMDMGLPLGHAIAFTIATNGICLTSIALLIGAIGKKTTTWLTILFWAGSFILGFLINLIL
ncbi:hypothetical protein AMJ52_05345 [candidate division TA06 bacterium DG_78]|uniref:Permease n=1 Tax=candidate division TA06 bacterium DG_78 TaxID=1703772 RepID=A0A0S7YD99_UNCT6|nr:MAG: hypothetical protein AMJ52_05345 [candidate division TA06 bacterium DG_78]